MNKATCRWEKARPVAAIVAALLMMLRVYVMTVTLVDDAGSPRQAPLWLQVGTIMTGGCLGFVAMSFAFPSCFWCDVRRTHWRELCKSARDVARDIAWVGRGVARLWRNVPSIMRVLLVFLVAVTGASVSERWVRGSSRNDDEAAKRIRGFQRDEDED